MAGACAFLVKPSTRRANAAPRQRSRGLNVLLRRQTGHFAFIVRPVPASRVNARLAKPIASRSAVGLKSRGCRVVQWGHLWRIYDGAAGAPDPQESGTGPAPSARTELTGHDE